VYVWIWRHLPGGLPGKLFGCLVLVAGAAALLFFFAFPWVEPRLPFNHLTVDQSTSSPAPSPTASSSP
jgi:hypothetical protein